MIRKTITLELTIDEDNIADLYPNYRFSFANIEQFVSFIQESLSDGIADDNLETFGYSLRNIADSV